MYLIHSNYLCHSLNNNLNTSFPDSNQLVYFLVNVEEDVICSTNYLSNLN